jgi:thiol-disulfide isomerase/thioredoxin
MKQKFQLLLLFCMMAVTVSAQTDTSATQKDTSATFSIGDPAAPLRVREWIKGTPVKSFEKGKVYVVEFWATWCMPCIAAMPHLSGLARKYKRKVTFSAIDVYEAHGKTISIAQIKAFADGMGRRMDFNVAVEDTNFTAHDWLEAYGQNSIPTTFVINGQGKVAWIGHPNNLDTVLRKIVNNTWDIGAMKQVWAKGIFNDHWEKRDMEVIDKVRRYQDRYDHLEDFGKPDSALFVINEIVKNEPDLKYTPWMVCYTFHALLRTDLHKAYEFGKQAMATTTYQEPAYHMIIGDIRDDLRKINMPPEIYQLGAECYQAEIDRIIYPKIVDMAKKYREMAEWYRLAGDKLKAIQAEKKAIKFEKAGTLKNPFYSNNKP